MKEHINITFTSLKVSPEANWKRVITIDLCLDENNDWKSKLNWSFHCIKISRFDRAVARTKREKNGNLSTSETAQ